MRNRLTVLSMLLSSVLLASPVPSTAQVSVGIGIGMPGVSIGINLPAYPDLVPVPGYPVYYAPRLRSNYFFYDGMYWVYRHDNWYASYWYNGPWGVVVPQVVPVYILRIPVRYYRQPPPYFRGWRPDGPPRWGHHYGKDWEGQRSGWDRWDPKSAPRAAPLPDYQRRYTGQEYPSVDRQRELHNQNYQYEPQDNVVREHYRAQRGSASPHSQQSNQGAPQDSTGSGQQQAPGAQGHDKGSQGQGASQGQDKGSQGQGASQGQDKGSQGQGASQGQDKGSQGQGASQGQDKGSQGQAQDNKGEGAGKK
jgi:hypothetical protein